MNALSTATRDNTGNKSTNQQHSNEQIPGNKQNIPSTAQPQKNNNNQTERQEGIIVIQHIRKNKQASTTSPSRITEQ
jgi:hypothetical protein